MKISSQAVGLSLTPWLLNCTTERVPPQVNKKDSEPEFNIWIDYPNEQTVILKNTWTTLEWGTEGEGIITIDLSNEDGIQIRRLAEGISNTKYLISWVSPAEPGFYKLLISHTETGTPVTSSDLFKVRDVIKLTFPIPEETYNGGEQVTIQWDGDESGRFRLRYQNGISNRTFLIADQINELSYVWTLPLPPYNRLTLIVEQENTEFVDEITLSTHGYLSIPLAEHPDLDIEGKVVLITKNGHPPFSITRLPGNKFLVLSRICTHQGCTVGWEKNNSIFVCPCHGSEYYSDGSVKRGIDPDQDGLPVIENSFNEDETLLEIYYYQGGF